MSIVAGDLICYGAASRVTSDSGTVGGAIDALFRPVFTQMTSNHALEAVSSSASDTTQTLTVVGRDAAGVLSTSTVVLTGTSAAQLSPATVFQRILSVSLSATALGVVTVRTTSAGATWGTIPIGEKGFYAMFINSASAGSTQTRWEKIFWKNTNGSLTLTSSQVTLTADPNTPIFSIGVAAAIDDSTTITNRITTPGVTFVGLSVAQSVPNSQNLPSGSAIGVWIQQALPTNQTPLNSTFTTQLSGNTT